MHAELLQLVVLDPQLPPGGTVPLGMQLDAPMPSPDGAQTWSTAQPLCATGSQAQAPVRNSDCAALLSLVDGSNVPDHWQSAPPASVTNTVTPPDPSPCGRSRNRLPHGTPSTTPFN